jgi:hypothetical protein
MNDFLKFDEFILSEASKTLYSPGNKDAVKGTGYKDEEAANKTIDIINKLKEKDFPHAMAIATTMENRAKNHPARTGDMMKAAKIFREWIDKNKKSK